MLDGRRSKLADRIIGVAFAILAVVWITPILLAVAASFGESEGIRRLPGLISRDHYSLEGYAALLSSEVPRWLGNSGLIAAVCVITTLGTAVPLAYASAIRRSPFASLVIRLLLITYLVPATFLLFPLLSLAVSTGTRGSLILVGVVCGSLSMPFAAWVLENQFATAPYQLYEMGRLDGLSLAQWLRNVVIPTLGPALLAVIAFSFVLAWGEYAISNALLPTRDKYPLATGVTHFLQGDIWAWEKLLAAVPFIVLPAALAGAVILHTLPWLRNRER